MSSKICSSCGSQNDLDSMFCVVCGEELSVLRSTSPPRPADYGYTPSSVSIPSRESTFLLASWPIRFVAWFIDWIILFLVIGALSSLIGIFSGGSIFYGFRSYGGWLSLITYFGYWVLMEYMYGATFGKMILNLKIVNIHTGQKPTDIIKVFISVLGKTPPFLLIDFFFALFISECEKFNQRIFQRAVDLVVIVNKPTVRY